VERLTPDSAPEPDETASSMSRMHRLIPLPVQLLLLLALSVPLILLGQQIKRRREMPIHRETIEHSGSKPPPQPIPREAQLDHTDALNLQTPSDGAGHFFHRQYRVDIAHPKLTPEDLMREMQANPNGFSPLSLAIFQKTKGEKDRMEVGDEFFIHITGPWNGPVRTIEVSPTSSVPGKILLIAHRNLLSFCQGCFDCWLSGTHVFTCINEKASHGEMRGPDTQSIRGFSHLSGGATETSAQPAGFGTWAAPKEVAWLPGVHRAGPSPPHDEFTIYLRD
jgi:hypothetical protein